MREFRTYGSVRGVSSNGGSYRDWTAPPAELAKTQCSCGLLRICRADYLQDLWADCHHRTLQAQAGGNRRRGGGSRPARSLEVGLKGQNFE